MKRYIPPALILLGFLTINSQIFTAQDLPAKKDQEITQKTEKQEQKKEAQKESPQLPIKSAEDVTWRDILALNQRTFDKSISQSTFIISAIGSIATLIMLGIGVASFLGIRGVNTLIAEINQKRKEIDECHEEIKKRQRDIEEKSKKYDAILANIEKSYQEIQEKTRALSGIQITESVSKEVMEQLSDLVRKTDLAEFFGLQLKPDDYLARGNDLFFKGLYDESLKAFEKVIKLESDNPAAWYKKGVALGKLGRNEEALKAFEKALELKPDYAGAWNNKGVALGKLNRYDDSLNAYEKAIALKPDDADAWANKGFVLDKLNRHDDALKAHEKAIELKPNDSNAWFNKACCCSLLKNKFEALKSLAKAIQLDPKYKKMAKSDEDFKGLWEDEDFRKLTED